MRPPALVRRQGLLGPARAAATALTGAQIVCTYVPTQQQQVLIRHHPLLTEAERDALEASLTGGVVAIDGIPCVPAEKSEQQFEPLFGDYPAAAPERIKLWRATIKYYVVSGT